MLNGRLVYSLYVHGSALESVVDVIMSEELSRLTKPPCPLCYTERSASLRRTHRSGVRTSCRMAGWIDAGLLGYLTDGRVEGRGGERSARM
jgi:hypothetical protein